MNKKIEQIVERANKALGSNSSRGTLPYCKWLEQELIKAEQQLKNCNLQNVSNPVKIATLKYENHNIDCLTFGKEYEILRKDNYTGGRIHIKNDNGDYGIYKISNFNCC